MSPLTKEHNDARLDYACYKRLMEVKYRVRQYIVCCSSKRTLEEIANSKEIPDAFKPRIIESIINYHGDSREFWESYVNAYQNHSASGRINISPSSLAEEAVKSLEHAKSIQQPKKEKSRWGVIASILRLGTGENKY